jgi:hypothetical protein
VVAEDLAAERDQHDPKAADHREAERVRQQILPLVPERVGEVVAGDVLRHLEIEHQQRDRDREDAVAEGDDPRELDLVLVAVAGGLAL